MSNYILQLHITMGRTSMKVWIRQYIFVDTFAAQFDLSEV